MLKSKILVLGLCCSAFLPMQALADEDKGFYLKAGYGSSFNNPALESDKKNYTFEDAVEIENIEWDLKLDDSSGFDVGFGYDLGKTRLEFLYSSQTLDVKRTLVQTTEVPGIHVGVDTSGDLETDSYILSINRDFPSGNGFTPYVGLGAGFTSISQDAVNLDLVDIEDAFDVELNTDNEEILDAYDETVFTYQVKAGLAKAITEKTELYVEGAYSKTSDYSTGSGNQQIDWKGLGMYSARVGLTYKF